MLSTIKKIFESYFETAWKKKFYFVLFFWVFVAFISILEPLIFSKIIAEIEDFYKTGIFDTDRTINIIILWSTFIILALFLQYVYDYFLVWKTVNKNYVDESNKYWKKIISMNYSEYLIKKQWSLYKIFDRWTDQQCRFLYFFFTDFVKSISSILAIIVILFLVDFKMAVLTLFMVPFMVTLGIFFMKKLSPYQKKLDTKWENIFATIWNILSWFILTKTLWLENLYIKKIKTRLNNIYNKQIEIDKYWSISAIYSWMMVMIARIIVLWFWVFFVIEWTLSFAHLFLFFSYIWWIYFPLGFLFIRLRDVSEQISAVEKMHKEFDNMDLENINKWVNVKNIKGNIEYKNISFGYSKNHKILNDISFNIKSWEKVAFVWSTWAWKSTIVNLLFRFWDTDKWEVLIDWKRIETISKKLLRKHIWIVMQDNILFNTTIKENLLFANSKATKKDIEKALKNAEADFVFDLENGIDTIIGERGMKMSWWEKQRLSIARLFLQDPEILILDEATSALDNKTEILVQKSLNKLMKWKTSIIIAHRLSTIQNADKILMLEKWKIIEEGSYKELIKKKGKFYNLANPKHLILN